MSAARCLITIVALLIATVSGGLGCPQTIEVAEGERRPDAAVVTLAPRPACEHEVREGGSLTLGAEGQTPARLVRWLKGALLVRVEQGAEGAPPAVAIDQISKNGALERSGTTTKLGVAGPVLALAALAGGGSLVLALTRAEGRVEIATMNPNGELVGAVQTVETRRPGPAELIWFRNAPVISIGGTLLQTDGSPLVLGGGEPDAGPAVPPSYDAVVVAGETLGWLRRTDDGAWLEQFQDGGRDVLSVDIGRPGTSPQRLLWAGDRYLLGRDGGSVISRYIVYRSKAARGSGAPHLVLGGRMEIPAHSAAVSAWAWDSAGPAHFGLAQVFERREIRFTNVALSGLTLDAPVHLTRERDVDLIGVVWDGGAYTVAWAERDGDQGQAALFLVRFRCPDEG